MADEKKMFKMPHNVIMEDRKRLMITGVSDIDSFDEETILLFTEMGELTIKGLNLHINKIDVDIGELNVEGDIWSLTYSEQTVHKGGLFARLFR